MGIVILSIAFGLSIAGIVLSTPFRARKKLDAFHATHARGKTSYPVKVKYSEYKDDTYFLEFLGGTKKSLETYDFIEHDGALAFTQEWNIKKGEDTVSVYRRMVSIPLARDFGNDYVQIQRANGHTRISDDKSFVLFRGKNKDIETDSIAFNEKFYVTGSSEEAVVRALPPRVQNLLDNEHLFDLKDSTAFSKHALPLSIGFRTGAIFVSWWSQELVAYQNPYSNVDVSLIEENDAWFADWLGKFREALESVTGPQIEGDAFAVAPVSREFLESKSDESLEKLIRDSKKYPWIVERPWILKAGAVVSGVLFLMAFVIGSAT